MKRAANDSAIRIPSLSAQELLDCDVDFNQVPCMYVTVVCMYCSTVECAVCM